MGTRSDIIVQRRDGTWKRIYCHWDGYPSHHGPLLTQHYNTQAKAEALVKPGDLSSLGTHVGKKHDFDWSMKLYDEAKKQGFGRDYEKEREWMANHPDTKAYGDMCLYYGRDRGQKEQMGAEGKTLAEVWPGDDSWTEYTYVWDGEQWLISSPEAGEGALVPLVDVLKGEKTVQANVKAFGMIFGKWSPKQGAEAK